MFRILAGAWIALQAGAAAAAPVAYMCSYTDNSGNTGVSEKVLFEIDAEAGTARAYDAYIHNSRREPMAVSLREQSGGKYLLEWRLNDIRVRSSNRKLVGTFSARVDTNRMESSLRIFIHSTGRELRGSGTCSLHK